MGVERGTGGGGEGWQWERGTGRGRWVVYGRGRQGVVGGCPLPVTEEL